MPSDNAVWTARPGKLRKVAATIEAIGACIAIAIVSLSRVEMPLIFIAFAVILSFDAWRQWSLSAEITQGIVKVRNRLRSYELPFDDLTDVSVMGFPSGRRRLRLHFGARLLEVNAAERVVLPGPAFRLGDSPDMEQMYNQLVAVMARRR